MEELAPIVLFTYNRPHHTKQTLDALAKNIGATDSVLYIYCDSVKKGASAENNNIQEVRKVAHAENRFKNVIVFEQLENKGLAISIIDGVTEILQKHSRIIVLEDDLITSPYFLQYMNNALSVYEFNEEVACISGYVYPVKQSLPETFFIKGADCWGWSTWKRAWDNFEKDGKLLLSELERKQLTGAFDFENSYPYTQMLQEQIAGKNNSWAVRWYASTFLKNKFCLYPNKSLVQNIGIDGSGTHSGTSDKWQVNISTRSINVSAIRIEENVIAQKAFIQYFKSIHQSSSFKNTVINKLQRLLKRKNNN